jgi:hypothetical protein
VRRLLSDEHEDKVREVGNNCPQGGGVYDDEHVK